MNLYYLWLLPMPGLRVEVVTLFASSQKFAHSFRFSLFVNLEKPLLAATSREKISSLWKRDEDTLTSHRSFPTSSFHQMALRREARHGLIGWDVLSVS